MTETLDPDEETLFANSAYANKFWADSIDVEEAQLIRAEMARRKQGYEEASKHLSQSKFWGRGVAKKIVRAGVVYPCKEINARSVARFQRWLAGLRLKDPQQHELIVKWLREEELGAERERHRQEAILREQQQRLAQEQAIAQAIANRNRAIANQNVKQDRVQHGAADRRVTDANSRNQQEQIRQEASHTSQGSGHSGPTCVFCDRPGIASTASGWMCGIHAQGLL